MYDLLNTINYPRELRQLDERQLKRLAGELRAFLLESVSQTGGHLSSNLGTVELTIALHYVFDTPHDRIVWDVGHQTYGHKVLTGRREGMKRMRMWQGLSGFPCREESEYDTFGTAHSSTSISAALGMAVASKLAGVERHVIAAIGDGAMTAGMVFEALNNAGAMDVNLLVILNDNEMSISPPVGALNKHLAKLMSGRFYTAAKRAGEKVLGELAKRAEEHMKGMVTPGTLFEELGFNYIGPIDGHDLDALIPTLRNMKELKGPQFLHIVTRKGAGYKLAEADPVLYHGVSKFDASNGIVGGKAGGKMSYTQVFGDWLCDMAALDEQLVGITPAMREGSGMVRFAETYPERYFDVGIAEQHAVTFAAGLACEGYKPVVAIYSTFLQRAYDQLIHDVQIQNLPIVFAIDRAGLVGADGATHNGSFDLTYLRCLPNMTVMTPSDENECRQMLFTAFRMDKPVAVRYPRGIGPGAQIVREMSAVPIGKGEIRRRGNGSRHGAKRVALLAFGSMVKPVLGAAEEFDATVADMRFVKPLDEVLVLELAGSHDLLVTVEENVIMGGAGSAVLEALERAGRSVPVLQLGLPDRFIHQGDPGIQLASVGLNTEGIIKSVRERLAA
ncbi:MAG: 1-deoxy-D-xylulose-5-phosphate synthase [Betaproteobacteria bacterium]|nr:1-deoxy-D-xylulose-5-phosphate synthase [Betaproteobacteria bacterium]MDH3436577.1 1-deoxy-D-xylulose-5-phosphate synthase [Betaproteobacteria bacterium]